MAEETNKGLSGLVESFAQGDPNFEYGDVLPIKREKETGDISPSAPNIVRGLVGELAKAIDMPGRAVRGERISPGEAALFSLAFTGSSALVPKPSGAITMGIGKSPISKKVETQEMDTEKLIDEFGESKQPVTNLLKKPKKTKKAYKLFRQKEGKLYPLFVGKEEEIPIGKWVKAGIGEQTKAGKVKSSLGELAFRPGFHSGELPRAPHIGGKIDPETGQRTKKITKPNIREDNQVWAEVEVADDVDWQKIANERAARKKDGTINVKTAHITDQLPSKGNYKYKTNPNMEDSWIISGEMKVNKILNDNEVKEINSKAGVEDLPRAKDIIKNMTENKEGGSIIASNPYGNYEPRGI